MSNVFVVPSAYTSTNGGGSNGFPFSPGSLSNGFRYQQKYVASAFSGVGTITQIAFRVATGLGFSNVSFDIKIAMAYATVSNNTPFASNISSNNTVLLDGVFSKSATGGSIPNPFDFTWSFSPGFHYDPAVNPLLVDFTLRNNPVSAGFDFVSDSSITRFYGDNSSSGSYTDANSANGGSNSGVVTQFTMDMDSNVPHALLYKGTGVFVVPGLQILTSK